MTTTHMFRGLGLRVSECLVEVFVATSFLCKVLEGVPSGFACKGINWFQRSKLRFTWVLWLA